MEIRHGEVGQHVGVIEEQDVAQRQQRLIVAMEFLKNPGAQEVQRRIGLGGCQGALAPNQGLGEFTEVGMTPGQQAELGTRNSELGRRTSPFGVLSHVQSGVKPPHSKTARGRSSVTKRICEGHWLNGAPIFRFAFRFPRSAFAMFRVPTSAFLPVQRHAGRRDGREIGESHEVGLDGAEHKQAAIDQGALKPVDHLRYPGPGEIEQHVAADDEVHGRGVARHGGKDIVGQVQAGETDHPLHPRLNLVSAAGARDEVAWLHPFGCIAECPVGVDAGRRACQGLRVDVGAQDADPPAGQVGDEPVQQDGQ